MIKNYPLTEPPIIEFSIMTPKEEDFHRAIENIGEKLTERIQMCRNHYSYNFKINKIRIIVDDQMLRIGKNRFIPNEYSNFKYPPIHVMCKLERVEKEK